MRRAPRILRNRRNVGMAQLEIFRAEDRIWSDFERQGDPFAFGARWAGFSRASVFPNLALGLEGGAQGLRADRFVTGRRRQW